jgi:NAD(P)H dehydrogenase (quinone)
MDKQLQHLILYAHPSAKSFSNRLKERISIESTKHGWKPVIRDLYQMGFDPVLSPSDLEGFKSGKVSKDIESEQELVRMADLITIIYPLWWAGFPAILKGYIDRVFSYNFAYRVGNEGVEGLLTSKKVMLFTTMGNSLEEYEAKKLIEAFRYTMGKEIFSFCGMEIINHQFFAQISDSDTQAHEVLFEQAFDSYQPFWKPLIAN